MAEEDTRQGEEQLTFEQAMERLEAVAAELERPETPLDRALSLYEEGVRLARRCAERLANAELVVTRLGPELETPDDPEE